MKKIITASMLILGCLSLQNLGAQTMPTNFFGINYWMPNAYINFSGPNGQVANPNIQAQLEGASSFFVRIGGGGYDTYGTANGNSSTNNDYIKAIASVKLVNPNAKFLIQIPYKAGVSLSWVTTLVTNIKSYYSSDIFYYTIGNEWDNYRYTTSPYNKIYSSSQIASNIKSYATAIKEVDNRILIVAPSLTNFYGTDNTTPTARYIMQDLIGGTYDITGFISGTGTSADGFPYIDIVDYHTYAGGTYGDMSYGQTNTAITSTDYTNWRCALVDYPNGGSCVANGFKDELKNGDLWTGFHGLQKLINNANTAHSRTGSTALTFAITEINICATNPYLSNQTTTSQYENTINGIGSRSFFAGQYWADMFGSIIANGGGKSSFVMPWSIWEHNGDGGYPDHGMTKGTASTSVTPTPLPTYYHYEMIADNFKYCTAFQSVTSNNTTLKAFGSYNSIVSGSCVITGSNVKYTVVLLNQTSSAVSCTLWLDAENNGGNYVEMGFPCVPTAYFSVTVAANSTQVYVFNDYGEMLRKIEYKQSDGATGKPVYTNYNPIYGSQVVRTELGNDINSCCVSNGVTLTSVPAISGATYTWYSAASNYATSLQSGSSNTYVAANTNTYKVVISYGGETAEDYITVTGSGTSCCRFANGIQSITSPVGSSALLNNAPNPTSDKTAINYILGNDFTKGEIRIMDIFGKIVSVIPLSTGTNSIEIDCALYSNGIYFYSLLVNNTVVSTKKMVVAK